MVCKITMQEYAKREGISYEAVRKQVARYRSDLQEHITASNRQILLDDAAIRFLDAKRQKSVVAQSLKERAAAIAIMQEEIDLLRQKLQEQQDRAGAAENKYRSMSIKIQDTEAAREALERRSLELDIREAEYDKTLSEALKGGIGAFQTHIEGLATQAINKAQDELEKVRKTFEDRIHFLEQENEKLRNRTIWEFLRNKMQKMGKWRFWK